MASENAKAVAQEVIQKVRKGQRVQIGQIIKGKGYSESVSKSPTKVTRTKAYQDAVAPLLDQIEKERQRAISMLPKAIGKAKYRDLIDGIDKLTKNHQLLSGKSTSNVAVGYKNMTDDELYRLAEGSED